MTSVWVLQPKLKIEIKGRNNGSSINEANALANALPNATIIGSSTVPIKRISPKEFFGDGKVSDLSINFKSEKIITSTT